MSEKLQKLLARAGLGSRREAEEWIKAGRVSVNGEVQPLGARAEETDKIRFDGKIIRIPKSENVIRRVICLNKAEGVVCTTKDPEGRPTVFDNLPRIGGGRWIAIGRLDINTSGLLLFTNDGELANRLMHPRHEIVRKYACRVRGEVSEEVVKALSEGVQLEDGKAHFESIRFAGGEGSNQWYHVTLKEGKNREVRRLWESQDCMVSRLHRIEYGPIELAKGIKPGRFEELDAAQVKLLEDAVGLEHQPRKPSARVDQKRNKMKKFRSRSGASRRR